MPMSQITLKVNGKAHTVDVEPSTPLLYVLGRTPWHSACGC
jgi:aerobic-type carbon monoxide dehydrogenase small subunit (CoxS/CutS family)